MLEQHTKQHGKVGLAAELGKVQDRLHSAGHPGEQRDLCKSMLWCAAFEDLGEFGPNELNQPASRLIDGRDALHKLLLAIQPDLRDVDTRQHTGAVRRESAGRAAAIGHPLPHARLRNRRSPSIVLVSRTLAKDCPNLGTLHCDLGDLVGEVRDRLIQNSVFTASVSGPGSCEFGTVRGAERR